nr:polyadenylate-binding protein 2-like [Ipomoea batatas]
MLSTVGAMAAVAKAASTAYYYAEHFGVFNREAKGEAETRSVEVAENQSANVGIHLFNGIGYDIWSSKMKSLFLSQDLWDMVEGGYIEEELTVEVLREVRKKDAMALLFIQQAIDKSVFSCITGANKSKEAWDALQKKYEGDGMTKSTKVYVANLSESTTKKDLREAFGYFGKIASTVVVRDEDGKSKCFGFVNFKDADNASWSIEVLNGHKFDDKEWCVRRYQKKSVKRAKNKSVDESVANASKSKKAGNAVFEKKITGKPEKQSVDESLPSSSAKDTCSQLVEPWGVTPVTMPTPSASSVAGSSSIVVAAPSSSHTVTAPVLHDEAVVPSRRPGRGREDKKANVGRKRSCIEASADPRVLADLKILTDLKASVDPESRPTSRRRPEPPSHITKSRGRERLLARSSNGMSPWKSEAVEGRSTTHLMGGAGGAEPRVGRLADSELILVNFQVRGGDGGTWLLSLVFCLLEAPHAFSLLTSSSHDKGRQAISTTNHNNMYQRVQVIIVKS